MRWPVRPLRLGGRPPIVDVGVATTMLRTGVAPTSPPTLATILPATGTAAGGVSVTLAGTGFTGATGVTIGAAACSAVVVVSDVEITATTPLSTVGALDVVVQHPLGDATLAGGYAATLVQARAVDLDGVNDVPRHTGSQIDPGGALSVGLWVRHDNFAIGNSYYPMVIGTDANNFIAIRFTGRGINVFGLTGGALPVNLYAANALPASNAWTHVGFVRTAGGGWTLYANGAAVGTTATHAPAISSTTVLLGDAPTLAGPTFNGRIAQAYIAFSDLTAAMAGLAADKQSVPTAAHVYLCGDGGRAFLDADVDGAGSGTNVLYDWGTVGGRDLAAGAAQGFGADSIVTDYPA